jgi:formimidoylglutamate deiminase
MDKHPTQTLWFQEALLPEGWAGDVRIEIAGGRIGGLARGVAPLPDEARHGVALPGLANLHSHAFQRGMAGLAERRGPADDNFWTWREVMYRFLDRLDPDDILAIAALAFAEMLETGFTRVGEFHYLHNDPAGRPYANPAALAERIAAAAAETGIALTLLPVFYAHSTFGGAPATAGQRRFLSDRDGFAALVEGARHAVAGLDDPVVGVAPHSLRAVTPDELAAILKLAGSGPIHIHAAEQVKEVEDCLAWSGQRPVEWLLDHAEIDRRWCLVHATHMTPEETDRLAASGAVAGLCPITEANLGDGLFPTPEFLASGGHLGLGTDSNILIDAAAELRALEYGQRLARRGRNLLARAEGQSVGATLFGAALEGGAQALGVPESGLAVGAAADIVSLNLDHPSLAGRRGDALLDGWIFAGRAGMVETVWRFGRIVVQHGRHRDAERIGARYRQVLARILAS